MIRGGAAGRRIVFAVFGASLALVAGGWLWAWLALKDIDQPLIIHFNNYVQINQIGSLTDLGRFALGGAIMVGANFFVALELEARDRFLSRLIAGATLALCVLLFVGLAAIISVN